MPALRTLPTQVVFSGEGVEEFTVAITVQET